jgi:hypothetical protein
LIFWRFTGAFLYPNDVFGSRGHISAIADEGCGVAFIMQI